jgi:hypothetical protein
MLMVVMLRAIILRLILLSVVAPHLPAPSIPHPPLFHRGCKSIQKLLTISIKVDGALSGMSEIEFLTYPILFK